MTYLLPKGYIGWFEIRFGVSGAPALPKQHGTYIARVNETGLFETSTNFDYDGLPLRPDRFCYVTQDEEWEEIANTSFGEDNRIWVGGGTDGVDQSIRFFVGSERQWQRLRAFRLGPAPADLAAKADAPFVADRYLIPEGFRGWVEVAHGVEDAETPPVVDGFLEIPIPLSGRTAVTAHTDHQWRSNEFFFVEEAGRRSIPEYDGGQGRDVEAIQRQVTGGPGDSHWFFVGTRDEYEKAGAESGMPQ